MMRLKSKLLSLNSGKADKDKMKVFSPRNCEELRIPFKTDKIAKVVGKLATVTPPTQISQQQDADQDRPSGPIITGVLVQNDFKLSFMAPEDLHEYAGLTTTTIVCRQRLTLSAAGIELIRWALEGTFGAIEELPEMHKQKNLKQQQNGKSTKKIGANGTSETETAQKNGDEEDENMGDDKFYDEEEEEEDEEEEADEEINKLVAAYLVMGCVSVRYYANGGIELEWEGNLLNDGIADAVMAVLFSVESSPAAVKREYAPELSPQANKSSWLQHTNTV